jgi:hypothetical protein
VHRVDLMSIRIALALATFAATLVGVRPACATPSARLVYSRGPGAESCPDEVALRREVAARVGYDPFFLWADKTIVASVVRAQPSGFVARVHLVDSAGADHGMRELHTDGKCDDLLGAAALAIAIAIDPLLLAPQQTSSQEEAPVTASPPPPAVVAPSAPAPLVVASKPPVTGDTVRLRAMAGAVASLGVAPAPAAGLSIGAEARWHRVSLELEARVDAPVGRVFATPSGPRLVSSWLAAGTLAPCVHAAVLLGCALVQLGSVQASAPVSGRGAGSAPWVSAGARVGSAIGIGKGAEIRLRADVLANLDRAQIGIDNAEVWKAPLICSSYGLDVSVPFL